MLPLAVGAGYNSQGVTSSNWAIVRDELIARDKPTSSSWPSAGAGVNSQGVTSSVGPVAVARGYTGTDTGSGLEKVRLSGEKRWVVGDCLRETGDGGLSSVWEGPGKSSQGVTSSTGPVLTSVDLCGAGESEICGVEDDENDLRFCKGLEDAFKLMDDGDVGTG